MDKITQKICGDVVEQYKQDKNVLGILLFGSVARRKSDQYSDVDIFILLRKKGKISRSNFVANGLCVDVIFNFLKEAKTYLERDKGGVRRITSHMLAHGEVLFERGKMLKKMQRTAQENLMLKTVYRAEEVLMHKYSIDDFWGEVQRDLKKRDFLAFGMDSQLLVGNILELFLKLHGEFLRQPNEMGNLLEKADKRFFNLLEDFYRMGSDQEKKAILAKLVEYIYEKSGGPLPEKWIL